MVIVRGITCRHAHFLTSLHEPVQSQHSKDVRPDAPVERSSLSTFDEIYTNILSGDIFELCLSMVIGKFSDPFEISVLKKEITFSSSS